MVLRIFVTWFLSIVSSSVYTYSFFTSRASKVSEKLIPLAQNSSSVKALRP